MATLLAGNTRALTGVSVDLAQSRFERQRALEIHRDVYRRKGLLPEEAAKPRVLPQAFAPGSAMFVAKEDGAIVGTITFYMDSAIGLPMDQVHGDEVDAMRGRFARVAEVGGLAVLEDRRGFGITMMLYQATFRWALATCVECLVACVNPSSRRVYSKLLFFEVLGECRPHPRFLAAPSLPIGLDLTRALARYRDAHAGAPDGDVHGFLREAQRHVAVDRDAARFLQWSGDEVSEMIEAEQLVLIGNDQRYVERHYSRGGPARRSG